ncbi:hypothetical protein BH23ACT10_BH23ACT10_17640 [soil metagenome]
MTDSGTAQAMPPAVLVGLDSMQGLQVARLLTARGVDVTGVATVRDHYATFTRICREIHYVDTGTDQLVDLLLDLARRLPMPAVLTGCQDKNVLVVSRRRDELTEAGYRIRLPHDDVVRMLSDKVTFADYARKIGLAIPVSYRVDDREDLEMIAPTLPYPAVVKPPSRSGEWVKHTRAKAVRVESADELRSVYDLVEDWFSHLVVQQWVEGPESNLYSFNGCYDEQSQLLVSFIARKLRQYPPRVGQSAYGEEVRADAVLDASHELFQSAGVVGLAYLEMKKDQRTGKFFAIEPNIGRPTGRSAIAEAGGVALHYTAYCEAAGLPLPPLSERTQRYGDARWIHVLRDTQTSIQYMREGELSVGGWLRSLRGRKAYAVLSARDPMPFLAALWQGAKNAVGAGETRKDTIAL